MSRLAYTVGLAATLAAAAYVVIATAQTDTPAVSAGQLAVGVLLAFANFVVVLALYVAVQACHVPQLARRAWARALERHRIRRAVRERRARHRARCRIGGAR